MREYHDGCGSGSDRQIGRGFRQIFAEHALVELGNHGALYRDAGGANLWDEPANLALGDPDKTLVTAIDQALASGKPMALKGGTP